MIKPIMGSFVMWSETIVDSYFILLAKHNLIMQSQSIPSCSNEWYDSLSTILYCLKVWDQTIAAVGSLLTLFILLIYISQNRLLKEQAKAMKAAYTPSIIINQIEALDIDPREDNDDDSAGDLLRIVLSNVGNGSANNLSMEYVIKRADRKLFDRFCKSFPVNGATTPIFQEDKIYYSSEESGTVLPADSHNVPCISKVQLSLSDDKAIDNPYQFSNAVSAIGPEDNQRVLFGICITYENSIGEKTCIPIQPAFEFDITDDMPSFKTLYDTATGEDQDDNELNAEIADVEKLSFSC